MEQEPLHVPSESQQKILERVALILRWQRNAVVSIGQEGVTVIFSDGGTLFFAADSQIDSAFAQFEEALL